MNRGTCAVIDLGALRHNLRVIRQHAPGSKVLAVVKANAYGHGLEPVTRALPDVDGFAVATLEEGLALRAAGVFQPIVLMEGVLASEYLNDVAAKNLDLVIHSNFQLEALESASLPAQSIRVWLKIDTGMHRLGIRASDASAAVARLRALSCVKHDIVLMSHLANADDLDDDMTLRQIERFQQLQKQTSLVQTSLANSAGVFGWPASQYDWVRCGLALYGASPILGKTSQDLGLRPCMTLKARIIAVQDLEAGAAIGYGGSFRCSEDMRVGVVGIGYGDGYPRHAGNGAPVLIHGHHCPIVGRVSMDMISVDLSKVDDAQVGDEVVLWGEGLPIELVAQHAETIPYELMCAITSRVSCQVVSAPLETMPDMLAETSP